jgi:hypothetical protein
VDEHNNFIAAGETRNVVVIIMLGKVKTFQGINTTLFLFYPYIVCC